MREHAPPAITVGGCRSEADFYLQPVSFGESYAANPGEILHGISTLGLHNGGVQSQLTRPLGYRDNPNLYFSNCNRNMVLLPKPYEHALLARLLRIACTVD